MFIRIVLDKKETKKVLFGLGATLTKLVEEMKNRYTVYLDNPNLMLATFFDPRYKHWPFKKEPSHSVRSQDAVEKLVVDRYLEHEKDKLLYEEQKKEEQKMEEQKKEEHKNEEKN